MFLSDIKEESYRTYFLRLAPTIGMMTAKLGIENNEKLDYRFIELLLENSISYDYKFFRQHSKKESFLSKFKGSLTLQKIKEVKEFEMMRDKLQSRDDDFQMVVDTRISTCMHVSFTFPKRTNF